MKVATYHTLNINSSTAFFLIERHDIQNDFTPSAKPQQHITPPVFISLTTECFGTFLEPAAATALNGRMY
jgi:hypothetical protein